MLIADLDLKGIIISQSSRKSRQGLLSPTLGEFNRSVFEEPGKLSREWQTEVSKPHNCTSKLGCRSCVVLGLMFQARSSSSMLIGSEL